MRRLGARDRTGCGGLNHTGAHDTSAGAERDSAWYLLVVRERRLRAVIRRARSEGGAARGQRRGARCMARFGAAREC